MRTYFSFGLILRDIPNSITPQTTIRLIPIPVRLLVLPCTHQCRRSPLTPSPFFFPVPDGETREGQYLYPWQACAITVCSECAVKHSDLTWPDLTWPDLSAFMIWLICTMCLHKNCNQLLWCSYCTVKKNLSFKNMLNSYCVFIPRRI